MLRPPVHNIAALARQIVGSPTPPQIRRSSTGERERKTRQTSAGIKLIKQKKNPHFL